MNHYLVSYAYDDGHGNLRIKDTVLEVQGPLYPTAVLSLRERLRSTAGWPVSIIAITKLETP